MKFCKRYSIQQSNYFSFSSSNFLIYYLLYLPTFIAGTKTLTTLPSLFWGFWLLLNDLETVGCWANNLPDFNCWHCDRASDSSLPLVVTKRLSTTWGKDFSNDAVVETVDDGNNGVLGCWGSCCGRWVCGGCFAIYTNINIQQLIKNI